MKNRFFNPTLLVLLLSVCLFAVSSCNNDDMKKQQSAFYVDGEGNLLDKKGELVKSAGEFKLVEGFYVDNEGNRIKRKIEETKEKINTAIDNTKEKVSTAIDNTAEKVGDAASMTVEGAKTSFKKMFNTKAVGETYTLTDIAFDKESHRITAMSKEEVEGLAAALKDLPASRIQVQVHTADGKNNSECKEISALRAEVVKDMLVTLGVSEKQVSAKGMGLSAEDATKAVANKVEIVVEE